MCFKVIRHAVECNPSHDLGVNEVLPPVRTLQKTLANGTPSTQGLERHPRNKKSYLFPVRLHGVAWAFFQGHSCCQCVLSAAAQARGRSLCLRCKSLLNLKFYVYKVLRIFAFESC